MKHRTIGAGLLAGALLAGCAAAGVKVTDEQLAGLRQGQTTADEVVHEFGPPTTRVRTPDGSLTLIYSYAQSTVRAATLIPVVGLFAGGADSKSSMVMLRFDKDGRLLNYTSSSTQIGTGNGLAAGDVDMQRAPGPKP